MSSGIGVQRGPIAQLTNLGQSLWLDNIHRDLITLGGLASLRDEGVTGVTSNPTITRELEVEGISLFEKSYESVAVALAQSAREIRASWA